MKTAAKLSLPFQPTFRFPGTELNNVCACVQTGEVWDLD